MNELDEFLGAGLEHYQVALQTAARFEDELAKVLDEVVAGRAEPDRFALGDGQGRLQKARNPASPWVQLGVPVVLPDGAKANVALGVWWSAPQTTQGCVVYAGFQKGAERLKFGLVAPPNSGVRIYEGGFNHVFVDVHGGTDIREAAVRALDALLAAVELSAEKGQPEAPG